MAGLTVEPLPIAGAFVITLRRFADGRGAFLESWRENGYAEALAAPTFVQDNLSYSGPGVVRGLHYQAFEAQAQLVTIVKGQAVDVLVDLRRGSPTFRKTAMINLDADQPVQIYMPPGIAHGFQVTGAEAILHYKCSRYYNAASERGLYWNDPVLGLDWPLSNPIISERDAAYPYLADIRDGDLPD